MDLPTLILFIPACFALNMAPGPNNLLSVSNSTRYGFRTSCLAGFGRLLAFAGMIALASAGLAVVLQTSELLFYGIKILGAGYLIYLAIQLWRANPDADTRTQSAPVSLRALARQEFLVAAGNPKAILIFTAFLPQFIDPTRGQLAAFQAAPRIRTGGTCPGPRPIGLVRARAVRCSAGWAGARSGSGDSSIC